MEQTVPGRRWRVPLALLGLLALLLGAVAVAPGTSRGLALRAWQWMIRGSRLEFWDGQGWRTVPRPLATKTRWEERDAFLLPAVAWERLAPGFDLGLLTLKRAEKPAKVALRIARVEPRLWRFRVLAGRGWPRASVAELARAAGAPFAVNGAFFSDEGPLGLVVIDGERYQRQVRHKASHFLVDGPGSTPRIVSRKGADWEGVDQAFQGFPAIMRGGQTFPYMRQGGRGFPVLAVDRRTAACVARDEQVLILVTDSLANGLSFYELATVMGGLGCVDAMGFDGGSSTGLYLSLGGRALEVNGLRDVPLALGVLPLDEAEPLTP